MIRLRLQFAALATAFIAIPVSASPISAQLDAYVVEARALVAAVDAGNASEQGPALQRLASRADAMIAPFVEQFPVCGDYLKAAQGLNSMWPRLSLERIEADYHKDGALPRVENAQDRALCYQMKDLLVHPLTGLRLLKEPELDVASLRNEIDEVVSHAVALNALVAVRSRAAQSIPSANSGAAQNTESGSRWQ